MRKKLFLILVGFILGISFFVLYEKVNIFLITIIGIILSFALYFLNRNFTIFILSILLAINISSFKINSFKLKIGEKENIKITILKKEKRDGYYSYLGKEKKTSDKVIFSSERNFSIGDNIRAKGELTYPNKNTNPYLFSYRNYQISKGVKFQLKVQEIEKIGHSKNFLINLRRDFYSYVEKVLGKNLSVNSSEFLSAVILAKPLSEAETFRNLGIGHILAVSGLHIDILLAFILFLFDKVNLSYRKSKTIGLLLCLAYGYLIGFPYSVIRVLGLEIISFVGFLANKREDRKKSLILVAMAILIFMPFAILNLGFILSFAASFAIYTIYPKIKAYFKKSYINNRFSFITSINLSLIPITSYYFGIFNIMTIPANFLIVPIFELSLYIIFLILVFYPILGRYLTLFFMLVDFLCKSILIMAHFLSNFKFLTINFPKESPILGLSLAIFAYVIIFTRKNNKKALKIFLSASLSLSLISFFLDNSIKKTTFSMVDIGQGDCFLMEDSGKFYFFDIGNTDYKNFSSYEKIIRPILRAKDVDEIQGVFVSHNDKDHVGNLENLSRDYKIKKVISNKANKKYLSSYNFYTFNKADTYKGENFSVICLNNANGDNDNNKSMALLIKVKNFTIMTCGDLESEFEDEIARPVDILKVSHHGSKNSTDEYFVKKTKPKISLISAGRNNSYGHPSKEVVNRLKNTKIYNTQKDGYVEIEFYRDKFKLKTYNKGGFFR